MSSFLDKVKSFDYKRLGTGIATGGFSEQARLLQKGGETYGKDYLDSLDPTKRAEAEYGGIDSTGQIAQGIGAAQGAAAYANNNQIADRNSQVGLTDSIQQRMASGNTISGEILRQGVSQGVNAQRSLAAGASPANSAMAQRQAAMQTGRLTSGLAGQQAVAGMQERLADEQNLGQMLTSRRDSELNAANSARTQQIDGALSLQNSKDNRFGIISGTPTAAGRLTDAAIGVGGALLKAKTGG